MESKDKDTFCISRNNAIVIGFVILLVIIALFANFVNSTRLSGNSRASGTDLGAISGKSYKERVNQIEAVCQEVKGYMARIEMAEGLTLFDRFSGKYYSLEAVNPVVTPVPGKPDSAYCSVNGRPEGNWCSGITSEGACRADCEWIVKNNCSKCAPKGVDPGLICP